jgi:hypothetical protein
LGEFFAHWATVFFGQFFSKMAEVAQIWATIFSDKTYVRTWPKKRIVPSSGANPSIASYKSSVVNFYSATDSLARLKKTISFYCEKRSSLPQRWRCSCNFKSRRIGTWAFFFKNSSGHAGQKHLEVSMNIELSN